MNYLEAVKYLDGFANLERSPLDRSARSMITLESVRRMAHALGDPQKKFASIHVAGTKGKGSTCAFAASILRAQGLRVGLYVSPHLEDLRERITIDGQKIPEPDFARIMTVCSPVLEALRQPIPGQRRPTYFEIVTHMAFTWFAEQEVDAAAIEVGLGGRLDATNIIVPEVCGIANISYDHTAILGETLTQIAREKAGIFKPGVPVVSAPQCPEVAATLRECADASGVVLETVGQDIGCEKIPFNSTASWPLPRARARMPDGTEYCATLGLRGRHQIENWALALRLSELFYRKRLCASLSMEGVERGSRDVQWPGRLERVESPASARGVSIFYDGAHNAFSVETVMNELHEQLHLSPLICLFGCARDKDVTGMLKALARPSGGADHVIFTDSGNPRGCSPGDLAKQWAENWGKTATVCNDSREGLSFAINKAGQNGTVIVIGSLYLIGKLKASAPL